MTQLLTANTVVLIGFGVGLGLLAYPLGRVLRHMIVWRQRWPLPGYRTPRPNVWKRGIPQ